MVFHVLACLAVVVAESYAVRVIAVFFAADDRTQFCLVIQECPQTYA